MSASLTASTSRGVLSTRIVAETSCRQIGISPFSSQCDRDIYLQNPNTQSSVTSSIQDRLDLAINYNVSNSAISQTVTTSTTTMDLNHYNNSKGKCLFF